MELAAAVREGNRLALARLLTQVENDTPQGRAALNDLFQFAGQAHLVGVTGAPGTGKSSLVNQVARYYRQPENGLARRVAIIAIDPSSPFTGGAILGDRVRMRDLAGDPDVFIRSMASRGSLGGLATTAAGVAQVLDAAGFELILIETVGAGQGEVDIARLAHTTIVVEAPGLGDDIQAIKAGILEIADILVVNKADLPGVESTEKALRGMLQLAHPTRHVFQHHGWGLPQEPLAQTLQIPGWEPPVLRAVAIGGHGLPDLVQAVEQHRAYLLESGEWQRRESERLRSELDDLLRTTLARRWRATLPDEQYEAILNYLYRRQVSPWQAVEALLAGGVT